MRNSLAGALLALALPAACGDSNERAPAPAESGGTASSGRAATNAAGHVDEAGGDRGDGGATAASAGAAGSSSAGDATLGGEASLGGEANLGGSDGLEPMVTPLCPDAPSPADETELVSASLGPKLFGGISEDERVLAWTVSVGDAVVLHYATREAPTADFAAEKQLTIPAAPLDAIALSEDGLRVVYVSEDRRAFAQLSRSDRDADFEPDNGFDFDLLAAEVVGLADAEGYGDPVLAPNDRVLLYSRFDDERTKTIFKSDRFSVSAPWPEGSALPIAAELEAEPPERMRPTALSADGYSLFVWDSAASSQWLAAFEPESGSYAASVNLGDLRGATPNPACTRIYYGRAGGLYSASFE